MSQHCAPAGLVPWVLSNPQRVGRLDIAGWQRLVGQARSADLLGQLGFVLHEAGLLLSAPARARHHFTEAGEVARKHAEALRWKLRSLHDALLPVGVPVILLKGAAYGATGHRAARGRLLHDIDILVPLHALDTVEEYLRRAGWLGAPAHRYDAQHYRQWTHDIPRAEAVQRGSVLDVHHALVPPTSGIRPHAEALFDATSPLGEPWPQFRVLSPEDMAVHCAAHLFFGEFHKGLRDLYDFHTLVSAHPPEDPFWNRLLERAFLLGLELPVADALRQSRRLFETDIPAGTLRVFSRKARGMWPSFMREWLFEQVLRPPDQPDRDGAIRLANWLGTVRSHWLRMPLPLLVYHLSHKLTTYDRSSRHGKASRTGSARTDGPGQSGRGRVAACMNVCNGCRPRGHACCARLSAWHWPPA